MRQLFLREKNDMDIKATLKDLKIDLTRIEDEYLRGCIILLLNAVEQLSRENDELRQAKQALKDENNRLKGEQGKPSIWSQKKNKDISSEQEHRSKEEDAESQPKETKPKKEQIDIDRIERCLIHADDLPVDARFKGFEFVVIQDIKITTNNVRFDRETYYSSSLQKTYLGPLQLGYQGQFGSGIKSLVLSLYQDGGMMEPALKRFLQTHGIFISSGKISNIITQEVALLRPEKPAIVAAGLSAIDYLHMDDTGLTIIKLLSAGQLIFYINEKAYLLMTELGLRDKRLTELKQLNLPSVLMTESEMNTQIRRLYPKEHRHQINQRIIREAAAITAYQQQYGHRMPILLSDGALQFQGITEHQALFWVHEGRHYKKLNPVLAIHQQSLNRFRQNFWAYYHELRCFKKNPSAQEAERLSSAFDELFSQETGYHDLDHRIASTVANKSKLLLVLRFPHLPLHNNPAELAARVQARKRDINLQTKNKKGTQSKDTLMTVIETAKKLDVNIFQYIYDRISGKKEMPALADLIKQRSEELLFRVPIC